MAFENFWYLTDIPSDLVDIIERDAFKNCTSTLEDSRVGGNEVNVIKRNSKNSWIPTSHWIGGFIWHYVQRANRENFLYDITCVDAENLQYTQYSEGQYYGWHTDDDISQSYVPEVIQCGKNSPTDLHALQVKYNDYLRKETEYVRKLSVVLQLSDPDDYEGGNLQFLLSNGKKCFAPRKRGTIVVFDSRTPHRVLKIKSGIRKSIVGWVVGPRWK